MTSTPKPTEPLKGAEVEFLQCLLDRYGESGKLVDLADWSAFMRIVRKHAPAIAALQATDRTAHPVVEDEVERVAEVLQEVDRKWQVTMYAGYSGSVWDYYARAAISALSSLSAGEDATDAMEYASNLATVLREKHYPEASGWKPSADLMGVLLQIDNMTSGLTRAALKGEG